MGNVEATNGDILVFANLGWGVREGGMKQEVLYCMELFGQVVPD